MTRCASDNRDFVYLLFFISSQLASAPHLRLIPYRVASYSKSVTIAVYVQEGEGAKLYRDVMAVGSALVHVSS